MKQTIYVLDTNVILDDPYIVKKLEGKIVIPFTVLKELDTKKNGVTEMNRNAREFGRIVADDSVKIEYVISDDPVDGSNDERIIRAAIDQSISGNKTVLLTNDILMRVMANGMGLTTMTSDIISGIDDDSSYMGIRSVDSIEEIKTPDLTNPNEYFITRNGIFKNSTHSGLKRLGKDINMWGIRHRNGEQRCAIDALLDDDIKLVTLSGKAGTGKTLLAIAAGLEKAIGDSKYSKLLVSRPIVAMGNDIGFLPGDINEKLGPWMQPIFDNIDFLFDNNGEQGSDNWTELEKDGLLKLEPLMYIRGRSIPNQFIIIDEAQNLTKHEVKTILSRAGENTKIILTGDPHQIDNPKLDSINNGLSYVVEKFKDQKIAAHISLTKCERSELADIASEIL